MSYKKKHVTFVIQNENHALNSVALMDVLPQFEHEEIDVTFLLLDTITGLDTEQFVGDRNVKIIPVECETPFYRQRSLSRFILVWKNRRVIREGVKDCDILVLGNDGSVQRLLASSIRAAGGQIYILFDGLLSPRQQEKFSTKTYDFLRRLIFEFAKIIGVEYLAPGELGRTDVAKIFVMDTSVKSEFLRRGVKNEIEIVTMPRLTRFASVVRSLKNKEERKSSSLRVLYITTAYRWHGLRDYEDKQKIDVNYAANSAAGVPGVALKVRVHPRDQLSDYAQLQSRGDIMFSGATTPLERDLAWCDVVLLTYSSVAYEAAVCGVPVFFSAQIFDAPSKNSYWGSSSNLESARSLEDVVEKCSHQVGAGQASTPDCDSRVQIWRVMLGRGAKLDR